MPLLTSEFEEVISWKLLEIVWSFRPPNWTSFCLLELQLWVNFWAVFGLDCKIDFDFSFVAKLWIWKWQIWVFHSSWTLYTTRNSLNSNGFTDRIVGNLRSKLPMKTLPSVIQSVTTNGKCPSVVTDWITDEKVYELKKGVSLTWRFLRGYFTNGFKTTARTVTWSVRSLKCRRNHRRIWNGRSVRWRVDFSVRTSSTENPSVKPSEKFNICHVCQPSPPLFLLLLPNLNSPHLQTTSPPSPPKQKSPSSQHNKLYFLKFCGHSIRVLFYRRILSIFVSNSIFLNFNV